MDTTTTSPTHPATSTCATCGSRVWANSDGGWSMGDPSTFVSIVCPGTARLHAVAVTS